MVAVMFKTQNLILDYYHGPMPESCLPGIILMPCFKAILTVVLVKGHLHFHP